MINGLLVQLTYQPKAKTTEGVFEILKSFRISNVNRLTIGQLNINSVRNKLDALKSIVSGNLDILVISESKIDESFPKEQFCRKGTLRHSWEEFLIYVRDDIIFKELEKLRGHFPKNLEEIFLELNLKISKWLLLGGYNPNKENIAYFFNRVGLRIDHYMPKYDNLILLEMQEKAMIEFSETYNLKNLIKDSTCFKKPS